MNSTRSRVRAQRKAQRRLQRGTLCGHPAGCCEVATHVLSDGGPGYLQACDRHWPLLVDLLVDEGMMPSPCFCPECTQAARPH